jgi:hypothetical protein
MWLWIGAGLIGLGSVLSAIPGRRRRPTDPVSRPVVGTATTGPMGDGSIDGPGATPHPEADPVPVGAVDPR